MMKILKDIGGFVLFTLLAMAVDTHGESDSRALTLSAKETLIGKPERIEAHQLAVSSDGRRVAWTTGSQGAERVVVNGVPGVPYHNIRSKPCFSPNGRRVAYAAERDSRVMVVTDGTEGKTYDRIEPISSFEPDGTPRYDQTLFSPDGKHVVYTAQRDENVFVVIDAKESEGYDAIGSKDFSPRITEPLFSPDGRRIAYKACRNGKWFVVIDGKTGQQQVSPDYYVNWPRFSPDSQQVTYWAWRAGDWYLCIDGKEIRKSAGVGQVVFSPDGKRMAYSFARGDIHQSQRLVVVDGKESKEYDSVEWLSFSPDGSRFAHLGIRGRHPDQRCVLVTDGQESAEYDTIRNQQVQFSPDGKRLAWIVGRKERNLVVVDGQEHATYARIGSPTSSPENHYGRDRLFFSSNGNRLAYEARGLEADTNREQNAVVVIDGSETKRYEYVSLCSPVFSPDSKHIAFRAQATEVGTDTGRRETRAVIVVDDVDKYIYDWTTHPVFTPDSRHVVFLARYQTVPNGHGPVVFRVIVDGVSSEEHWDQFVEAGVFFDAADKFHMIAMRDGQVFLVEYTIGTRQH